MANDEKEVIKISCPLCTKVHSYSIKVIRSKTISYITSDSWKSPKNQRQIRKTRIFNCPTKDQEFQAIILLWEWPSEPITSVEVEKSQPENEEDSANG